MGKNLKKRVDDKRGHREWSLESKKKVRKASMRHFQLNSRKWLVEEYVVLKKTTQQIAKEVGCVSSTVYFALIRLEIPKRTRKEARKGIKFSEDHIRNITKANRLMAKSGSSHWNWQGGKTVFHDRIRHTPEYKLWRKAVLERDEYVCQGCGKYGNNAHHILPQSKFPHLRFAINNGQTLCEYCHINLHSLEKGMNSGKPRTGNPEPSVQSTKVQRLLESSDTLNNQLELPSLTR